MRFLSNIMFLIAVLVTAAGCGGNGPIQPPPPPPPGSSLELSCLASVVREATNRQGTDVHFDAPTPSGGRAPYNVQCDPGSSSVFPIGETTVRCAANDADMRQASCSFPVIVRAPQTIAKTKFMAFGDSITDGKVSLAPVISLAGPDTYPFQLEHMLREKYLRQPIEVLNRGVSGERTDEGAVRLPGLLDADKPEVLLLLEGVNAVRALPTGTQEQHLQTMISDAKRRRVDVLIATVMPVAPVGRLQPASAYNDAIRALNERILRLADRNGLGPVVDLFGLFNQNMHLLGTDGLHPTLEGQTRIAEAFRDEIVRRYDVKSTTSLGFSTIRRSR